MVYTGVPRAPRVFIVRHPSRTPDGMYHIVDDGDVAAKFDTLESLHKWARETIADCNNESAFHRSEAEQAENFAASLTKMVEMYPNRRSGWVSTRTGPRITVGKIPHN